MRLCLKQSGQWGRLGVHSPTVCRAPVWNGLELRGGRYPSAAVLSALDAASGGPLLWVANPVVITTVTPQ